MRSGVRPGWWCLVAGLAYGALLTLALPPIDLWPLAFAIPAPLVLAGEYCARKSLTARKAGLLVALGSLPFWFLQTRWLIDVTAAGYPCLAAYQSIYTGLFVALLVRVRRARAGWPLWLVSGPLWVGLEVLRGEFVLTGFPWFFVAHPLIEAPILAAPAALVGTYGVSLLVVWLAASVIELVVSRDTSNPGTRRWYRRPLHAAAGTIAVWVAFAQIARLQSGLPADPMRIAVIQTNLPQSNKIAWTHGQRIEDFTRWARMTVAAAVADPAGRKPDVIIWPETMFPGDALNPEAVEVLTTSNLSWPPKMLGPEATKPLRCDEFARAILLLQKELGIPMVVGAITIDGLRAVHKEDGISLAWDKRFNSALSIVDGRINTLRYDKHSLTPFGEVIPWAWRIPALQRAMLAVGAGGMSFDLAFGERSGPLVIPRGPQGTGVRFVTPICFEVVRSGLCRRLVHEGDRGLPVMLVNISNDGWFGDWPEGRAQHFQIARWRCVELGVPMVRSVNTGISGAIDSTGRVIAKGVPGPHSGGKPIESHTSGVLTVDLHPAQGSHTPFSMWFGNSAGYGCLAATFVLILAGRRRGTAITGGTPVPPADAGPTRTPAQ